MGYTELDLQRLHYVRVSDVIGKQTQEEMRAIPIDTLANACIRGTKIHDYCTAHVKAYFLGQIEMEYEPYVNAFIEWYDLNVLETLHTNTRLYDDVKKFTGEFDMIVILKESKETAMIDLKTSANVSRSWPIQLAAYKHLCELNGYNAKCYLNLHLKKTKAAIFDYVNEEKIMIEAPKVKANEIIHENLNSCWEIFSSALNCYDFFNRKESI